jgi:hypothetical protein
MKLRKYTVTVTKDTVVIHYQIFNNFEAALWCASQWRYTDSLVHRPIDIYDIGRISPYSYHIKEIEITDNGDLIEILQEFTYNGDPL